ncbi:Precursor of CEP14 [Camellia lanceoleosa]|uniref:Precursor of CEP14 n=2 Tax=Camellia lanceoleosa TaxID=1840588 RepID=A0ACC0HFZ4_9ERIC|nr:Precursor of CEP14 [Camellia lanceoleosa]KAI8011355.1 Precursor of CEP14 [Camellia lanceoleosa]
MAFLSKLSLVFFLLICCACAPSLEARKLLTMENKKVPSLEDSLLLSALPTGTIPPPSSPGGKGHSMVINGRVFVLPLPHLDRVLQSVPSPGVGH